MKYFQFLYNPQDILLRCSVASGWRSKYSVWISHTMTEYISPEGLRLDGRRASELRRLKCHIGSVTNADGSAIFEMGNTKVLAAVFGPHEADHKAQSTDAVVRCQVATAPFSTGERRKRGKRDRWSLEQASTIREALRNNILTSLFPKTQIDVYVHVIQADGGILCAAINAGMLALADAGVPLRDVIASCSAGFLEKQPVLDLNYIEEGGMGPIVPVAFQASLEKVVMLQMDRGRLGIDDFEETAGLAVEGCRAVAGFLRESLLKHTQKMAFARGSL